MDIFDELEQMALNVTDDPAEEQKTLFEDTVIRWEKLFGYSRIYALKIIEQHRGNIARKRVSDEHWGIVREDKKAQGYDCEAYEHEIQIGGGKVKSASAKVEVNRANRDVWKGKYIVRLEEDLTPDVICELSGSTEPPEVEKGSGEDGDERFCVVDSEIREAILQRFSITMFEPTFVHVTSPAEKSLSSESRYPALGIDTTLPQYRPSICDAPFLPAQDEYPVWYFFYGTLADSAVLTRHLSLTEKPKLFPAAVTGGLLGTWGGTYRALVDGPSNARVQGSAFKVMTKKHEDALRAYETDKYKVVRCVIEFDGRVVQGCTFRFVGEIDRSVEVPHMR